MAGRGKSGTAVGAQLPYEKMKEFKPTVAKGFPERAIVREIDFEIRSDELWFFFSRWSEAIELDTYNNGDGGFPQLIYDIIEDNFRWENEPSYPQAPYSSPLSLNCEDWTYVVYVLSNKSWQFCRIGYPVTLGPRKYKGEIYWHAHRVSETGFDYADMGTPFDAPLNKARDNCMLAFFLADGEEARKQTKEYEHSINLHVDLIYGGTKRRFMPIMIDPDVRYPGGSTGGSKKGK